MSGPITSLEDEPLSESQLQREFNSLSDNFYRYTPRIDAVVKKAKEVESTAETNREKLTANEQRIDALKQGSQESHSALKQELEALKAEGIQAIAQLEQIKARLDGGRPDEKTKEIPFETVRRDSEQFKRFLFGTEEQQGIGSRSAVELFEELSRYKFGDFFQTQLPLLLKMQEEFEQNKTAQLAREEAREAQAKKDATNLQRTLWVVGLLFSGVAGFIYNNTLGDLDARITAFTSEEFTYLETHNALAVRVNQLESFKDQNSTKLEAIKVTVEVPE